MKSVFKMSTRLRILGQLSEGSERAGHTSHFQKKKYVKLWLGKSHETVVGLGGKETLSIYGGYTQRNN
jgi:hypothetical protein